MNSSFRAINKFLAPLPGIERVTSNSVRNLGVNKFLALFPGIEVKVLRSIFQPKRKLLIRIFLLFIKFLEILKEK